METYGRAAARSMSLDDERLAAGLRCLCVWRACAQIGVNDLILDMMKAGGYFYKHDFGRNKRSRKQLKLSSDHLKLTWKAVGATEGTDSPGASKGGILRSASFSRTTSSKRLPPLRVLTAAQR